MATTPSNPGIKQGWSLKEFVQAMGKPKLATLTNSETNEEFKALMFPTPQGERSNTLVAFSSKIEESDHNSKFISEHKDELRIVELESGNYSLCLAGDAWEDIDLW